MTTYSLGNLDKWVASVQGRVDAVVKQSFQEVIESAQLSRFKGGNMPIRDGFLRNSGVAAIGRLPSGESEKPDGYSSPSGWSGDAVAIVIFRAKPGEAIFFGWTAEYAKYMERRYGFMRLAAQKWDRIVAKNAAKLKNQSLSRRG